MKFKPGKHQPKGSFKTKKRYGKTENTKEQKPKVFKKKTSSQIPEYNFQKIKKLEQKYSGKASENSDLIRLNRYIANAGVCSRREADELIKKGMVKVNGKVVTEMGYKVKVSDEVLYLGKKLKRERKVYVLLNKPKGFITTTEDEIGRKTVMDLVNNACDERIYPVGRLDRQTTGLLIMTNDGDLAKKLAHPSGKVKKIYDVQLDKPLTQKDEDVIRLRDFELEDGEVDIDGLTVLNEERTKLGIQLHSGRNRIVRRIFAHFGYEVERLDRTVYAELTKKDLPRGKWRYLDEKEVILLKYFTGKNTMKKPPKEQQASKKKPFVKKKKRG
ncbi:pseudouridine synthase [Rapidithrix thailandica]|uniref:Pseudouridine synthase n=1 Tax=Rapidithrix thailandica TaxID=413964 RepID=A0AAW9SCG7_9BACT